MGERNNAAGEKRPARWAASMRTEPSLKKPYPCPCVIRTSGETFEEPFLVSTILMVDTHLPLGSSSAQDGIARTLTTHTGSTVGSRIPVPHPHHRLRRKAATTSQGTRAESMQATSSYPCRPTRNSNHWCFSCASDIPRLRAFRIPFPRHQCDHLRVRDQSDLDVPLTSERAVVQQSTDQRTKALTDRPFGRSALHPVPLTTYIRRNGPDAQ